MLVLSRKTGEKVVIANCITITVVETGKNKVRLGISAPDDISILRSELAAWSPAPSDNRELVGCLGGNESFFEVGGEVFLG